VRSTRQSSPRLHLASRLQMDRGVRSIRQASREHWASGGAGRTAPVPSFDASSQLDPSTRAQRTTHACMPSVCDPNEAKPEDVHVHPATKRPRRRVLRQWPRSPPTACAACHLALPASKHRHVVHSGDLTSWARERTNVGSAMLSSPGRA
jgi:hypothetical protein